MLYAPLKYPSSCAPSSGIYFHTMMCVYLQVKYDHCVYLAFQQNAWADKTIMKQWINMLWRPVC